MQNYFFSFEKSSLQKIYGWIEYRYFWAHTAIVAVTWANDQIRVYIVGKYAAQLILPRWARTDIIFHHYVWV